LNADYKPHYKTFFRWSHLQNISNLFWDYFRPWRLLHHTPPKFWQIFTNRCCVIFQTFDPSYDNYYEQWNHEFGAEASLCFLLYLITLRNNCFKYLRTQLGNTEIFLLQHHTTNFIIYLVILRNIQFQLQVFLWVYVPISPNSGSHGMVLVEGRTMWITWSEQGSGTLHVSWDHPWRHLAWWKSQSCC